MLLNMIAAQDMTAGFQMHLSRATIWRAEQVCKAHPDAAAVLGVTSSGWAADACHCMLKRRHERGSQFAGCAAHCEGLQLIDNSVHGSMDALRNPPRFSLDTVSMCFSNTCPACAATT